MWHLMKSVAFGVASGSEKKKKKKFYYQKMDSDDNNSQCSTEMDSQYDEQESQIDEQDSEIDDVQVHKKVKIDPNSVYRPPTNDEMNSLKETTNLFKSNLFKLQIEELLAQVSLNYDKSDKITTALHSLKNILDNMDSIEPKSYQEAVDYLKQSNIKIPFPDQKPPNNTNIKFAFQKPEKIAVVGSFLLKTITKSPSGVNIDLAIEMPEVFIN
jgi:U3 small nucleolar RNA-associated protein 22